jgi:uncharacterized protein
MMPGALELELRGQRVVLLAERAAYWRDQQMLWIADMHCGKAATFRSRHVPIPDGSMEADLARLTGVLERTQARRLAILGDWVHAARGCTDEVIETVQAWRQLHRHVEMDWIRGNHDRLSESVRSRFGFADSLFLDHAPFRLQHEPGENADRFTIAGHLHPTMMLGGRGYPRVQLPCFQVRERVMVLPAFTSFAGGYPLPPGSGGRVFLIASEEVVEWKAGRG